MLNSIICGDAFQLLKEVPDQTVDLILTDPPYNISRPNRLHTMNKNAKGDTKRNGVNFGQWDIGFDQTGWLPNAVRVMKKGGSIVIWNSWENLGRIAEELTVLGLKVKRQLVCITKNPMPRNRDRLFVSCVQNALWAVRPGAKWTFNRRPGNGFETGVFHYAAQRSKHPTKKPTGMFKEIIEMLSNPGDLVLDPFAGIGTTAEASISLQRNFICFEKDEEYFKLAMDAKLNWS